MSGDNECFQQAFGNLAYHKGPKKALAVFTKMIDTDPTVHVCHRIAHAIGAGALAYYHGKVGPAFADGSPVCWSGYYHGILERAFSGVSTEDMPAVARRLCASAVVRRNDFTAYQCVHGLGHGLMIYTGYDLPLALATCDKLATSWDQTSCTGGVFMENLQTSYGTTSQWLKDDNPLYPCTIVSEPAQALLLPDGHIPDSRRRRQRLGEDGRVVPQVRAELGRHVLPVARPRRVGTIAPEPEGDPAHLRACR